MTSNVVLQVLPRESSASYPTASEEEIIMVTGRYPISHCICCMLVLTFVSIFIMGAVTLLGPRSPAEEMSVPTWSWILVAVCGSITCCLISNSTESGW